MREDTGASANAETGSHPTEQAPAGLGAPRFDPARFRLRRVFNGTMTRGWQVLRDEAPISGLFDEREDAEAALSEFRTDEAIAIEAATAGETTKIGSTEGESAGRNGIAQKGSQ